MESVTLPHLAQHPLQIGFFEDVQNAAFLRQQLLQGNPDYEYAFLDASSIISRSHVLAACFRAIYDSSRGRLRTRNVHSEIVFSFSSNNNIAESFRRFGISDTSTHILAIKVGSSLEAVESHLVQHVQGRLIKFSDETIGSVRDNNTIAKLYRLNVSKKNGSVSLRKEDEAFAVGSMALKGS